MTDKHRLPESFLIGTGKVSKYLLNSHHPRGGSKAKFFLAFGFDPTDTTVLADALFMQHFDPRTTLKVTEQAGLLKYIYEGPIKAPNGREPIVRTVWLMNDSGTLRLLTALPLRPKIRRVK